MDFTPPTLKSVKAGVAFIQRFAERNEKVYVHCKAGRARSATIAICWLHQYRQMSMSDAQAFLLEKRPHVNPRLPQRAVVQEFASQHSDAESE